MTRKERKTYTEEEARAAMEAGTTCGRKGVKLPRINLAFYAKNYDYIKTMALITGVSMTEFINTIITQHRESHSETYEQALSFRKELNIRKTEVDE